MHLCLPPPGHNTNTYRSVMIFHDGEPSFTRTASRRAAERWQASAPGATLLQRVRRQRLDYGACSSVRNYLGAIYVNISVCEGCDLTRIDEETKHRRHCQRVALDLDSDFIHLTERSVKFRCVCDPDRVSS